MILPEGVIPASEKINNLAPVSIVRSLTDAQGTFVVKELVYAYAMWISPKFHIRVIRAFDALVSGNTAHAESIASQGMAQRPYGGVERISDRQVRELRRVVQVMESHMHQSGATNRAVYSAVRASFGLKSTIDMASDQFEEAMFMLKQLERLTFDFKCKVMNAEKSFLRGVIRGGNRFAQEELELALSRDVADMLDRREAMLLLG